MTRIESVALIIALVEFLLKWWPTSCEWLNACVAIERTWAVRRPLKYSLLKSKRLAKWIAGCVLFTVALISSPELIFRRMVIDTHDEQAWCVLTLNADRPTLLALYSISNLALFLLPLVINLASSFIIIRGTLRSKQQATSKNPPVAPIVTKSEILRMRLQALKKQISKHKHILIAPILLGLLALPRVVLAFVFVCTKLDRQPYLSLIAYCITFLPSMSVLFAFILPSHAYRAALLLFIKQILPDYAQNLFRTRQHTR